MNLPPKKEYVLYAPLSVRQREAYNHVLNGGLRKWLIEGGTGGAQAKAAELESSSSKEEPEAEEEEDEDEEAQNKRSLRTKRGTKNYNVDGDDDEYFEMLERGEVDQRGYKRKLTQEEKEVEQLRAALEHQNRQKGSLPRSCFSFVSLTVSCSQASQQYEAPECGNAATESMLASFPV